LDASLRCMGAGALEKNQRQNEEKKAQAQRNRAPMGKSIEGPIKGKNRHGSASKRIGKKSTVRRFGVWKKMTNEQNGPNLEQTIPRKVKLEAGRKASSGGEGELAPL